MGTEISMLQNYGGPIDDQIICFFMECQNYYLVYYSEVIRSAPKKRTGKFAPSWQNAIQCFVMFQFTQAMVRSN